MKGLAWYCLIMNLLGTVSMFVSALNGKDINGNVWGIAFTIPVIVFFSLYLKATKVTK